MSTADFNPKDYEKKWREYWEKNGTYVADLDSKKPHFYNLWMFPYPSAEGVHVGTIFSSTGSDVFGRFMRMKGHEVFQPMGYDSFGIHSENFALKIGEAPGVFAKRAIHNYERQFKEIGHGYDWSRSVTTSSPDYYKWTQWLFIQMFKAGLAYKKKSAVNWCPSCKTVLADEQITTPAQAGKWPKQYASLEEVPEGLRVCERCGSEPERKELDQWFFGITKYAEQLLEGLNRIDWSERVVVAQREWIGKKQGARVGFKVEGNGFSIDAEVFTTRIDTLFGVTFLVLAPEIAHEWMEQGWKPSAEVATYIEKSVNISEQDRKKSEKEKSGLDTGLSATNPATGETVPVWVADYVLKGVGTGVVMGVPAHDSRDMEFAKKHSLGIKKVVETSDDDPEAEGKLVDSGKYSGMESFQAREQMFKNGLGQPMTHYHLRDWLVSRQRYWGPPIPMVHCEKCGWQPVPEEQLPVLLPEIADYQPKGDGKGPLANHPEFYKTKCSKCGGEATRETDVSDTFVDSAWYFLRYPSVGNDTVAWDEKTTKSWLPVNLYFGGAEHSVLHLMYARFVTKVLKDLKLTEFDEPFPKFFAHGLMIKDGAKMSKSRGNVVNPDEYIAKYGADALRLYLMFMGPMDGYPDFRDSGMEGMVRWLKRLWTLLTKEYVADNNLDGMCNRTIVKVTELMGGYKYNTAIAELMKFVNEVEKTDGFTKRQADVFIKMLAPFAPHMTEEVWSRMGETESIHKQIWPVPMEGVNSEEMVTIVVQVNGKVRGKVVVSAQEAKDEKLVTARALEQENVQKFVGEAPGKTIFVPGRILSFVTA